MRKLFAIFPALLMLTLTVLACSMPGAASGGDSTTISPTLMLPSSTLSATAFLDIKEQAAKEHLRVHLVELLKTGYQAKAEIARGDPAALIVETAKKSESNLVLLGTHCKAGMDAFWAHSVAPNVARRTRIPILFIPLP